MLRGRSGIGLQRPLRNSKSMPGGLTLRGRGFAFVILWFRAARFKAARPDISASWSCRASASSASSCARLLPHPLGGVGGGIGGAGTSAGAGSSRLPALFLAGLSSLRLRSSGNSSRNGSILRSRWRTSTNCIGSKSPPKPSPTVSGGTGNNGQSHVFQRFPHTMQNSAVHRHFMWLQPSPSCTSALHE